MNKNKLNRITILNCSTIWKFLSRHTYSWSIGVRTEPRCPKMDGAKYVRSIFSIITDHVKRRENSYAKRSRKFIYFLLNVLMK